MYIVLVGFGNQAFEMYDVLGETGVGRGAHGG
jgi:hypothetical protein